MVDISGTKPCCDEVKILGVHETTMNSTIVSVFWATLFVIRSYIVSVLSLLLLTEVMTYLENTLYTFYQFINWILGTFLFQLRLFDFLLWNYLVQAAIIKRGEVDWK